MSDRDDIQEIAGIVGGLMLGADATVIATHIVAQGFRKPRVVVEPTPAIEAAREWFRNNMVSEQYRDCDVASMALFILSRDAAMIERCAKAFSGMGDFYVHPNDIVKIIKALEPNLYGLLCSALAQLTAANERADRAENALALMLDDFGGYECPAVDAGINAMEIAGKDRWSMDAQMRAEKES